LYIRLRLSHHLQTQLRATLVTLVVLRSSQPVVEVKTIGIIGARDMGSAIACAALLAGYRTILEDVSPEVLAAGVESIRHRLDDYVAGAHISEAQHASAIANFTTSRSVEDVCREADLLLESLPEELEVKLEIFTIFDKFAKPNAILASTTRETPIADLAGITFREENCVGIRFLEPAPESAIVEINRTRRTSDATVAAATDIATRMGKKFIVTYERES
jgi:3-hydroxybutyryl-CoA dehydrogenase